MTEQQGGNQRVDSTTDVAASAVGTARRRRDLAVATDDVLLSMVRGDHGDHGALAELYQRHHADCLRYAARLTRRWSRREAADDIVAEAMRKVISALRRGFGPTIGFRQYLFTAIRSVTSAALVRAEVFDDAEVPDVGMSGADDGIESLVARAAFGSLPTRWQQVLWMTKVDELTPTEIAPLIGMTPNSVAALSVRAREALRIAYVREHLPRSSTKRCDAVLDLLARRSLVRIADTKAEMLSYHLASCDTCRLAADTIQAEMAEWSDWRFEPVGAG